MRARPASKCHEPSRSRDGVTLAPVGANQRTSSIGSLLMMWGSLMTLICARMAWASIRRPVLLAFLLALILADCGGREQMAIAPHASERIRIELASAGLIAAEVTELLRSVRASHKFCPEE